LSSVESALFLREVYNGRYAVAVETAAEIALGGFAVRNNNHQRIDDWVGNEIDAYITLDVKELLNISYLEYLDLPISYKETVVNKLTGLVESKAKAMEELRADQELLRSANDA